MFQSTPPRGGRQGPHRAAQQGHHVSIHAPAWGATPMVVPKAATAISFNPRPRVGGDITKVDSGLISFLFQSTPPRGGRRQQPDECPEQIVVSIHAPAWGATARHDAERAMRTGFNPRPRVGGDSTQLEGGGLPRPVSIHAPAWGATTNGTVRTAAISGFNPRPRVGGDIDTATTKGGGDVSIHAPAWGATRGCFNVSRSLTRFNPRPRVGGDF